MKEILDMLPDKAKEDYYVIWKEYQDGASRESKFVHELDKLEMALQAKIYEKDVDPEKIKPFMTSAIVQIQDDDLKKLFLDITQ